MSGINGVKIEIKLQQWGNSEVLIDGKSIPCSEVEILPMNEKHKYSRARITVLMPLVTAEIDEERIEFIQNHDRWHNLKRRIEFFFYDIRTAIERNFLK